MEEGSGVKEESGRSRPFARFRAVRVGFSASGGWFMPVFSSVSVTCRLLSMGGAL